MSSNSAAITVKQLSSRLEASSSTERLDALQELQSLSRTCPDVVGEYALSAVIQILRSQGSAEEYSEALDLLSRLINTRDKDISCTNTSRILSTEGNVELLLDLLEHSDLMVGVMTSQILTELHSNDGIGLEAQIQLCPDGMNKLLQRLPDSSREEVRNQAIVLVQQLTSQNEEMKKTVAFNEGFEILFRIINEEGGSGEAGLVVSDCLKICNNILLGSEICQRLFFGMGAEWILRLSDFFNPIILERMEIDQGALMGEESPLSTNGSWFLESNRLSCAVLALAILNSALSTVNKKHQTVIVESAAQVLQSAIHWLARNGPKELVSASLCFLDAVVASNSDVAQSLASMLIKLAPNIKNRNISSDAEIAGLTFGWKPLPTDERRCISLLSLLAERYIFPIKPWKAVAAAIIQGELGFSTQYTFTEDNSISPFLLLFSRILSTDSMVSDTLVQFVLAPPPPSAYGAEEEDEEFQTLTVQLETLRPVCSILLHNIVQICEKLMSGHFQYGGGIGSAQSAVRNDLEYSERVSHVLTVVFMNGSLLARELSTAITTSHCRSSADGKLREVDADNKAVLPYVVAAVGKAARLQGGLGYSFVKSILTWMSTVVCGCERAVRLVFEDPANLFVVDLATSSSEAAGVPTPVQISACFFLGCAFLALPPDQEDGEKESTEGSSLLRRKTFLTVIDSRIGLNRFTELLKRPLLGSRKPTNHLDNFFTLPGFRSFFETHVEKIKDLIFEMYAGGNGGAGGNIESIHLQKIAIQAAKIKELEEKLQQVTDSHQSNGHIASNTEVIDPAELSFLRESVNRVEILQEELSLSNTEAAEMKTKHQQAEETIKQLREANKDLSTQIETSIALKREQDELILKLKQDILNEYNQRQAAQLLVEQRNQKISLLESELTALRSNHSSGSAIITQLQSERDSLQSTVKICEKQLQDTLIEKQDLLRRYEEEMRQRSDCQTRLEISENSLTSLRSQLDDAHAQLHKQSGDLHTLEKTNKELQRSIQVVREELASLNASSSQFANEELTKITHQVSELKDAVDQTLAAVEDFAESVDLDFEPYSGPEEDSLQKFVYSVEILEKLRQTISSAIAESSDLAESIRITDLSGAEGSLERSIDCYRRMTERVIVLEEIVVGLQDLQQQVSQYESKFSELEQEKTRLEEREVELVTECDTLKQNLSTADDKLYQANIQLSDIQSRLQNAEQQRDHFQTLHQESLQKAKLHDDARLTELNLREKISALESELQSAQSLNDDQMRQLAEQAASMTEKNEVISNLRQEVESLQAKIQLNHEQLLSESTKRNELEQSLLSFQQKYAQLQSTITERDLTISQLKNSVSLLEDDKQKMQQQLLTATSALAEAESFRDKLSKQLADLTALHRAKEEQSTLSQQNKDHLEMSLQMVRDQLKAAHADVEAEKKQTNELLAGLKDLQSRHANDVQELQQQLSNKEQVIVELQQTLRVLEESVTEKLDTIRLKDDKIKTMGVEREQLQLQYISIKKDLDELREEIEKERANAKPSAEPATYTQAMQLLDLEIKRLGATVNGLSKELLQKEHELRSALNQSARKEGELASMKIEKESLQEQVTTLRAEALSYSQQLTEYERKLHELTLKNQQLQNLQLEKAKLLGNKTLTDGNVLSHTERLQVTEAMYTLHSFVSKQSERYSVEFLRLHEGQFFTTHDLSTLVKAVKDTLEQVLEKVESQVEGFSKLVEVKEKEIAHLRSLQLHSSSSALNTSISPIKAINTNEANAFFQTGPGSGEKSRASYVTPARPGRGIAEPNSAGLWTNQPSTGRRAVSVTPAAKETARLHLELARERKRLDELQEEHSDLLGLLAQQEVELSVFKKKLLQSLGPDKAASVEEEAKSSVEKLYGTYTSFRPSG